MTNRERERGNKWEKNEKKKIRMWKEKKWWTKKKKNKKINENK